MVDKINSKESVPGSPFLEGEFSESPFLDAFVFESVPPEPPPEPEAAGYEDDEYEYDEALEDEMEDESGSETGVSPLAIPALKGWGKEAYRPEGWRGKVYGLVVHTTGSGVPRRAADESISPSAWAVRYYKRSRGCHYVNGWNGIDGGDLFQVANENVQAWGVGVTNKSEPKKDQRRSIDRGRFEKDLPAVLVRLWKERWPGKKNSLELLPGTKTANSCYIHMECPPCVYWHNGKTVTGEPPMRPGLRFTKAQHDSVARLAVDIARRNGWPMEEQWWRTPRLLGHEDLTPISRHDKNGGWDPGYLREKPYFDWDYVYETIEKLVKKEQGGSIFSGLGAMAKRFLALLFSGDENRALALAVQQGERDENKLTNMVFFARHPELGGRKLKSHEKELAREWLDIRDRLVRPVLQGARSGEIDEEMLEESELAEYLVEDSEEETGGFLDETGFEHHHHEHDEEWGSEDEEFLYDDEYEDEYEDEYIDEFEDEYDDEMEEMEDDPYMAEEIEEELLAAEEESSRDTIEGPGGDIDLARAVRLNRYYARKVGWFRHRDDIDRLLGFTTGSPDARALAAAVAGWQVQNGLGADGIIGPNTWKRMKAAMPPEPLALTEGEARQGLVTLGYDLGAGSASSVPRSILLRFQRDMKLRRTGKLDARTASKLKDLLDRLERADKRSQSVNRLSRFRLTTYYAADETDFGDNRVVPVLDESGKVLAHVDPAFFLSMSVEGTGRLRDGTLLNVTGGRRDVSGHPEYKHVLEVARKRYKKLITKDSIRKTGVRLKDDKVSSVLSFHKVRESRKGKKGYGILRGISYDPFRTLAADIGAYKTSEKKYKGKGGLVPAKTKVFILEMVGQKLPDGTVHDGWFQVNDTGSAIFGAHFDVFTGSRKWAKAVTLPHIGHIWFDRSEERCPPTYTYGLTK